MKMNHLNYLETEGLGGKRNYVDCSRDSVTNTISTAKLEASIAQYVLI